MRHETASGMDTPRHRGPTALLLGRPLLFMLLDRALQDSHDERVQRRLVLFGPASQLLVQDGGHANLEMDDCFWHGRLLGSNQFGPEAWRVPAEGVHASPIPAIHPWEH